MGALPAALEGRPERCNGIEVGGEVDGLRGRDLDVGNRFCTLLACTRARVKGPWSGHTHYDAVNGIEDVSIGMELAAWC